LVLKMEKALHVNIPVLTSRKCFVNNIITYVIRQRQHYMSIHLMVDSIIQYHNQLGIVAKSQSYLAHHRLC